MPTAKKQAAGEQPAKFAGFADAKCAFFHELAKKHDRVWFAKHKQELSEGYELPMRALLGEARAKLDAAYPDCDLAEPKIFRIFRDVRFSADKSPYKTHLGGVLYVQAGNKMMESPSPLYVQIGTKNFAAAGHYVMAGPQLAKFRASVLDDKKGGELAKITSKLKKAGYGLTSFESLKKVPRGIDPEHPRAELLKMKGLIVEFPPLPAKLISQRALLDEVVKHAKAAAPLVRWLVFNASG